MGLDPRLVTTKKPTSKPSVCWQDATEYRVDVAVSHALAMLGIPRPGFATSPKPRSQLRQAADAARSVNDPFAEQNAYALMVRVLLQQGRAAEACAIEPPDVTEAVRSMRGEVLASRSLALATMGRLSEALELGQEAVSSTHGIEARVLWLAIRAVVALTKRDSSVLSSAQELVSVAFEAEAVDLFVCAYRSNPELLAILLSSPSSSERTVFALARAGDHQIASAMDLEVVGTLDPRSTLSVREREVYDLVCLGLSNREIAGKLFISEATVKVHLHHVFDKVGIRSRTALAMNAVHERVRQATSTMESRFEQSA